MPITEQALMHTLRNSFPHATITLNDLAGDDDHWHAEITCTSFAGKPRITQHRMVQDAVKHHTIHALSITTKIPALN